MIALTELGHLSIMVALIAIGCLLVSMQMRIARLEKKVDDLAKPENQQP